MKHKVVPFAKQINPGIDRNDPRAEQTAIEIRFPDTFCERAWKVIRYFEGAMFLYVYKGKFVVTDESLYLTDHGDGSYEAPLGGPRWTGDSLEELETWLLTIADEYDQDGDIPGWEVEKPPTPEKSAWQEPSPNVLVTLVKSNQFIGVKTYCRKHGSHGRFLINQISLRQLLDGPVGAECYESDCGDYVKITRMENSLHFSFAWLNTYGDGSVKGIRQDITVPMLTVRLVLDWSEEQKYLYIPPTSTAVIDARPAAGTIRKIVKDKRLRRAFAKAMRDCFRWPGDEVTLYPDGNHSFFFTTKSGFPKNGGLILHESIKDGHKYVYYSVHT